MYHEGSGYTCNSFEFNGSLWEALQLHEVHKGNVFYKSHENPYQVLQVMCMHLNVQ